MQKKSTKSHPSLVRMYGVTVNNDNIYVVGELCVGGDLHNKLYNGSSRPLWQTRMKLGTDIAQGVAYLHSKPAVIHRDLKPANVVVRPRSPAAHPRAHTLVTHARIGTHTDT
eukprot:GHVU01038909.1.p1 GENE.GHVU01038909.1~~GHVU01038909.1.p1  ORF type:complete len:112 (+),score=2.72 GHVU01038909.1:1-336(+)